MTIRPLLLFGLLLLTGCGAAKTPEAFTDKQPVFDPLAFFTGHIQSWGVIETTGGAPQSTFTSDMRGVRDETGALDLTQNFTFDDGKIQQRRWHFVRIDAHHFAGTANDVVDTAQGEAYGNLFHWTYTLTLDPGHAVKTINMEQWMYLQAPDQADDETMVNRAIIRKFGLEVASVTEYFHHLTP